MFALFKCIYIGSYVENDADVGPYNTLNPLSEAYITPWARSNVPTYTRSLHNTKNKKRNTSTKCTSPLLCF